MNLRVLLPFGVFKDQQNVQRLVVETDHGSFGIYPQRLDCVAAIEPGILVYQIAGEQEMYIAVDAGIMVKAGSLVSISVRQAVASNDLKQLRDTVESDFVQQSAQNKKVHSVYLKMESDFIRRLRAFHHEI